MKNGWFIFFIKEITHFKCTIFYYLFKNDILILSDGIVNFAKNNLIMQEASFQGFIRTLIYIIAIYYIIKFLARIFLPILVKKAVEKAGENFQRQQQQAQGNSWQKTGNNDEVIIDTANAKNLAKPKKSGNMLITKK